MNLRYITYKYGKCIAKTVLSEHIYDQVKQSYYNFLNKNKTYQKKYSRYKSGINLFIHNTQNSGGVVGSLLQEALNIAQIPFRVIDLGNPERFNVRSNDDDLYNINLIVLHAASNTKYRLPLFNLNYKQHYNIGYWAWELSDVPDEFYNGLGLFNEFWAVSSFCANGLSKKVKVPVLTVPHYSSLMNENILSDWKRYFHINEGVFYFTFIFDCMSFTERKNPDAVVEAFIKVYSMFEKVGLILKYIYPESAKDYIDKIKSKLKGYENVFYFENFMTSQELRTLISISGAFISLHRAEGFGLLPLEAMGLGTPVIATEWSGNMEYMNHKNTALVGCRLVPVEGRYVGSTPGDGQVWAEPDVEEAVAYMSRMITDAEWRNSLISHGLETARFFTVERTGQLMRERLEFLGLLNGISQ